MSEEEDKQAAWEFELCYEGNPHGDLKYKDKDMRAAFLAGIAHGRKALMEGEPDGWCAWNEERKVWHFMSDGRALIYKTREYKGPLTGGFRYVPVKLLRMEVSAGE